MLFSFLFFTSVGAALDNIRRPFPLFTWEAIEVAEELSYSVIQYAVYTCFSRSTARRLTSIKVLQIKAADTLVLVKI